MKTIIINPNDEQYRENLRNVLKEVRAKIVLLNDISLYIYFKNYYFF